MALFKKTFAALLLTGASVGVMAELSAPASAAGFAVREQSAEYQGMSFAGNAAGTGLSVMFWNSAGAANKKGPGIHTESHYSAIFADSEVTVDDVTPSVAAGAGVEQFLLGQGAPAIQAAGAGAGVNANIDAAFAAAPDSSGNIAPPAVVPATYASMQVADNLFVGMAINSAFGLVTEPDDNNYKGSVLGRNTKLFTTNANPTVAMQITPGVSVGVGAQIQFGNGKLKFATGLPSEAPTSFAGDSWAFGATAGVLIEPTPGTRIGLGWRSKLRQNLKGRYQQPALVTNVGGTPIPLRGATSVNAEVRVNIPDLVTASFEQVITPKLTLSGTFEWANWSDFDELRLKDKALGTTIQVIPANWDDSYFYSLGGAYKFSDTLTVRTGVAYEISPTSSPEKRFTSIPDADRIWVSAGATYKWSEETSLDFAYTHIFVDDARFHRDATIGVELTGEVESRVDIISASLKTKVDLGALLGLGGGH